MRAAITATVATILSGCVQLVAFEQPVIGQPDVVDSPAPSGELVCDENVAIGASALCDESCVIDRGVDGEHCGGRVRVRGDRIEADVAGLHEVELTITVCGASTAEPFVLVTEGGHALAVQEQALAVGPSGAAPVYRHPTFLPTGGEEDCVDRTLVLQAGRMELAEAGRRLCSDQLPDFERTWEMRTAGDGRRGLRTIEMCLRAPR